MRNKNNTALFIVLLLTLLCGSLFASDGGPAKKLIDKGDKEFNKSHLQKAQQFYLQALAIDSTDAYTNFQVGAIYYLSDSFKIKSLPYFLRTIKFSGPGVDDTIIDAYYYMGNCYALLKNYKAAITAFNIYLRHIDPKSRVDATILEEVNHNIEICTDAPGLMNRSSDSIGYILEHKLQPLYIKNMGGAINTPYAEYAQVLMNHDSTIIFTSRRPTSQKGKKDFMTDEYYEDIFISHIDSDGHWETPTVFSTQFQFTLGEENLASVTITSDGHTLFIYHSGRIWETHIQNGVWSKPESIGKNIKQIRRYIPSVFVSYDNKKLFLVSDKKSGGYGGKDIYESDKNSDGTWSDPQNLGPNINTSFDEDSPFLMPDNKTLFFSSKGHVGLGGYDIFKSVYENGKWSKAVNLGSPINSSADDIYFAYDTVIKKGFFSSSRINQGYGNMDIYSFSFTRESIDSTMLQGEIVSNKLPVKGATISLTETRHRKRTYIAHSDTNGRYSVALRPESFYKIEIKVPGYLPYYTSVATPHQCDAYNLYQYVNTSFLTDSLYEHTGQNLSVANAFYRDAKTASIYKNVKNDPALSAFILNYKDTATIWEKDTTEAITYTQLQRDSLNPKKAIAINVDTSGRYTNPALASVKTAPNSKPGSKTAANTNSPKIVTNAALPQMPVVYFRFNNYLVSKKYFPMLDSLVAFAKTNTAYNIQIEGNTDTKGSAAYNKKLSYLRAQAVASYLIRRNIPAKRIHIAGNGIHHLAIVGDGTDARNRRDDIIITQ